MPITLAIPFYRDKDLLARCINSVYRQSSSEWELLIVDDHGPDGDLSEWLNENWGGKSPSVKYYRNSENLGMAGNWNRCLELSAHPFVTLLHSDDELLPEYVHAMNEAFTQSPKIGAFYCHARIINRRSRPVFSFPDWYKSRIQPRRPGNRVLKGEAAVSALLRGNFITCPTLCYNRNIIGEHRFSARWKFVLDLDFTIRLLRDGLIVQGLPVTAYAYRRHAENATSAYSQDMTRFSEEYDLYNLLEAELLAQGWPEAAGVARQKRIILLNLLYNIVKDILGLRISGARKKLVFLIAREAGPCNKQRRRWK